MTSRALALVLLCVSVACSADAPDPLDGTTQASAVATFRAAWLNARLPYPTDPQQYQWPQRRPRIRQVLGRKGLPGLIGMAELTTGTLADVKADLNGTGANWVYRHLETGGNIGEVLAIFWDRNQFDYIAMNSLVVSAQERRGHCHACKEDVTGGKYNCEDNGVNRGIITVHLRHKASNQGFYVYATHFPAPNSWPDDGSAPIEWNECERVGMAEIATDFIRGRSHPDEPLLFMGDFNAGYRFESGARKIGESYQFLIDELDLVDTFYEKRPTDTQVQTYNHLAADATRNWTKLDHIFASRGAFWNVGASIDRSMYTGSPGAAVDCPLYNSPGCNGLNYYADHWAVDVELAP